MKFSNYDEVFEVFYLSERSHHNCQRPILGIVEAECMHERFVSDKKVKSSEGFSCNKKGCNSLELMFSKTIGLEIETDVSLSWSITSMKYLSP